MIVQVEGQIVTSFTTRIETDDVRTIPNMISAEIHRGDRGHPDVDIWHIHEVVGGDDA